MNLYNQFVALIKSGTSVTETAERIALYHLRKVLTDEQVNSLYELMDRYADPESNRPDVNVSITALTNRLIECENKIASLEATVASLSGLEIVPPADGEASDYPDWKPWDGISRDYSYGDIVRHNGELWISEWVYQNTWEPGVMGTEKMWVKYSAPVEAPAVDETEVDSNSNTEVE